MPLWQFVPSKSDFKKLESCSRKEFRLFAWGEVQSKSPIKQMGQMILNIALCTMNLTTSVVKQALEAVRYTDLEIWLTQVFGQSMLSKRRIVFSSCNSD